MTAELTPSEPGKAPAFVRSADTTPRTTASTPWAVRMENIGKRYYLGELKRVNDSLGEEVSGFFGRLRGRKREYYDNAFWALKDINLEVSRGQTLGIIGRNGAGKSTMLKILSRITQPTTGEMRYRGRLASLLEVGTGFHRELTGYENIYLNGAILGMKRTEIARQMDAIIDFAGVEKFLNTPVKFYSSGMYVRLAFAVAAHLRADILVVDEVLAVGDAQFQKKCIGKMQDVASGGRTVLFVSHSMDAVRKVCEEVAILEAGTIAFLGDTDEAITRYLDVPPVAAEMGDRGPSKSDPVRIRSARVVDENGNPSATLFMDTPGFVEIKYDVYERAGGVQVFCHLYDEKRRLIFHAGDRDAGPELAEPREAGQYVGSMPIPTDILKPGTYTVEIGFGVPFGTIHDRAKEALVFVVAPNPGRPLRKHLERKPGLVIRNAPWKTARLGEVE